MGNEFYSAIKYFFSNIDLAVCFFTAVGLIVILTVLECVFIKIGKLKKGKIFLHITVCTVILCALTSLTLVNVNLKSVAGKAFLPILFIGVIALSVLPVKFLEARVICKKEHIDLAKLFDRAAKKSVENERKAEEFKPVQKLSAKPQPQKAEDGAELDFAHVKNVIERLNYYNLSPFDKRTVNELNANLSLAESGECGLELKTKINDGLSALLKIMSKYGA